MHSLSNKNMRRKVRDTMVSKKFWGKLLTAFVFVFLVFVGINSSKAAEISDVQPNYWAYREIEKCVDNNYLNLTSMGEFLPEATISRSEFVIALMKVLRSDDVKIMEKTSFVDVKQDTKGKDSIVTSQQMRIIFGYPDKTFKPANPTTRAEAMSAIGNITKRIIVDDELLSNFDDRGKIPDWARLHYAKNVKNDLYTNYPNEVMLRPNDNLTRAEAAVLLTKISENLELIADMYRTEKQPDEIYLRTEYLNVYEKAPRNNVDFYNIKIVVEAGNVFVANFDEPFNSKNQSISIGDIVEFVVSDNVYTDEGTLLLPYQSRLSAKVTVIKKTPWKFKNDKALLVINKVTLPNGKSFPMAGVPLTQANKLVKVNNSGFGERLGGLFRKNYKEESKIDFLVNYSNKLSPVIKYDNNMGDKIYVLLTGDMVIPVKAVE